MVRVDVAMTEKVDFFFDFALISKIIEKTKSTEKFKFYFSNFS